MGLNHVFTPIQIGGVEIANRVVRTAHVTNLWKPDGLPDDLIAYHAERARGGCGLSILEIMSVHPSSDGNGLPNGPELEHGLEALMRAVRPYGMRMFVQLWHGGFNASPKLDLPWSASPAPGPVSRIVPHAMTLDDINALIAGFVKAAQRCLSAGLDGIEVHLAHGYLLQQFLSPLTNQRTDEFGGNAVNRARLPIEILRALRTAIGTNVPLGVRVGPECTIGGMDVPQICELIGMFEQASLIDFVDISQGGYFARSRIAGAMHMPVGYQLEASRPISASTGLPTIVSGRFETLEQADQLIADGVADLVGLTRAQIAEPELVNKTRHGRASEVRPCIACNQGCLGGVRGPFARLGCTVNPAVGFERLATAPADVKNHGANIVVVGGGPAGMAAARAAALKGHRVTLVEARSALGGQAVIATRAPHYGPLARFLEWQEGELRRLGVKLHLATNADQAFLTGLAPDSIILATGSKPRMDGRVAERPGILLVEMKGPKILSSWEVLTSDSSTLGRTALVLDDVGHSEAIAVTEHLLRAGLNVTFVTTHSAFAPFLIAEQRLEPALERLQAARERFSIALRTHIVGFEPGAAIIDSLGGGAPKRCEADLVVLVQPNQPERSLLGVLAGNAIDYQFVGDARSPRFLGAAIREGEAAGNAV